ncbi:MAG: MOSC N-terminal beta barrel domain-containing protein [Pseudomonadota bacterium]
MAEPQLVGHIESLWQYPVKSMGGVTLDTAKISADGLVGDRGWCAKEDDIEQLTVVRRTPKLLHYKARYLSAPEAGEVPDVEITLPDGSQFRASDADATDRLSDALGKRLSLWPLQPKSNREHYRLKTTAGATELKRQFASDVLPDLSSIPTRRLLELMQYVTPLGHYYDVYPLHILSTGSLEALRSRSPEGDFRPERFRPNIVIDSLTDEAEPGFHDFDWVGGTLHIGSTTIRCESRTVRCSAPAQPQAQMAKDPTVLKTVRREANNHLGINATVIDGGTLETGAPVYWSAPKKPRPKKPGMLMQGRNRLLHASMTLIDKLNKS